MSYPINYPTPQGANVQIFNQPTLLSNPTSTWVKPKGASFVWFTLIGGGGGGDQAANGGGSGAVTNCMVPAFLIPDSLVIEVGQGGTASGNGTASQVFYRQKDFSNYQLLIAQPGLVSSGGTASTSNYFSCMGFYQSIAGQNGSASTQTASATTFLSGGNGTGGTATANYGYRSADDGYFQMQPIIVGVGTPLPGAGPGVAAVGCGGNQTSAGGNGLVVIITW